ncbi:MAG TPA: acyl-CoA dehydrogenase family protein [Candidatus Baltobacteraceae bacterium]|nr:acyl-CoA dehydrogenase family protein [Candidatus Baltobacteraceae bacterium]
MPDYSHLHWPFFDATHEGFAAALRGFLESELVEGRPSVTLRYPFDHAQDKLRAAEVPRPEDAIVQHWVRELAAQGFLRACIDLDVRRLCVARETLAYHDALADFAFAMQGLGSGPITLFGSPAQRERFLPAVTSGESIMAFALSEREAGSDVAAITTCAVRDGDAYVLDGEKTWISNAGIANAYVVFARTSDAGSKGLSAFIVPASTPGLSVPERIETISPHPLGTVRFERCRIPAEQRLGEEGQGFKIAMATLDVFRASVGAAALGFARRALDETVAHARERKLFGAPLAALQLTQAKIAQMATEIDASALLVYRAAYAKDKGAQRVTREAAMAKWFATETAARAADAAVQLFGGRGVTRGEIVERIYRDVRALRIYEGASEIQQIVIARSLLEDR